MSDSLERTAARRGGLLHVRYADKNTLYQAYMPFIRNGGLFVATDKQYRLGDEVFMVLSLMDEADKLPVAGRVVWITPPGAQGNRRHGIGVQFSEQDNGATRDKIETYLAGAIGSDRATQTL